MIGLDEVPITPLHPERSWRVSVDGCIDDELRIGLFREAL